MKHYILCGSDAVINFMEDNYENLEEDILKNNNGEIIAFDESELKDGLHSLLAALSGWRNFIQLSEEDLKSIEENTNIKIDWPTYVTASITWCTNDFVSQAEDNFKRLKKDYPETYGHLSNWREVYDESMFPSQLERMVSAHDASIGITWLTIDEYLSKFLI